MLIVTTVLLLFIVLVYEGFTFNLGLGHAIYFGLHWVTR